jgi:hypothetical protein
MCQAFGQRSIRAIIKLNNILIQIKSLYRLKKTNRDHYKLLFLSRRCWIIFFALGRGY